MKMTPNDDVSWALSWEKNVSDLEQSAIFVKDTRRRFAAVSITSRMPAC
ncbi:hypothetical protein HFO33_35915 [Rhizobium leguminosarum]|nr:hypothetical protein [Rhizobium leguminosarum]MBY5721871.1 hypothetical protein [Rhizobium leguminosarum]